MLVDEMSVDEVS